MATYDIARSVSTGLYWGGGSAGNGESFCVKNPAQAVAFGDQHRSYVLETDESYEFVRYTPDESD